MNRNLDRPSRDGRSREEKMRDDPIRDALRSTTEQASPYFNQKVLSRLESDRRHRAGVLRPALAAARPQRGSVGRQSHQPAPGGPLHPRCGHD